MNETRRQIWAMTEGMDAEQSEAWAAQQLGAVDCGDARREARLVKLLGTLMRHPGQALSRDTLLSGVWRYDFLGGSNVIDVYVRYLRHKLETHGVPSMIQTVRGVGYALREPE